MKNNELVILTGPTAVGKTELSIKLAKAINGEIISADSIQVYKKFDIGSAKITEREMQGVKHHLIDVLEPQESFNVATFKAMADEAIQDIYNRGAIPIITGGTGFYIQALLYNVNFEETPDDGYRRELEIICKEKGVSYLHNMLSEIDPESALLIHENNSKRVIRALEYHHQTGKPISEHNTAERAKESPYNFAYFVLNCNRQTLYERINKRVELMLKNGLVDEVKAILNEYKLTPDMTSMQGLGYKEIYQHLTEGLSIEDAEYIIKRDTRHFAKRQLTWFKREKDVIWLDKDTLTTEQQLLDYILNTLKNKNII